jgi:hypothetical protein
MEVVWKCTFISFFSEFTSGTGTAYPSEAPEFSVGYMFLNRQSSVWCFVDHCPFSLGVMVRLKYVVCDYL